MKSVKYFKLLLLTVLLVLCSIAIQPNKTYAADTYVVSAGTAYLQTGVAFQSSLHALLYNIKNQTSAYAQTNVHTENDGACITDIQWTNIAPTSLPTYNKVVISDITSKEQVIMYLNNLTDPILKLYTTANTVYLNKNSSYMLAGFVNLQNCSFLNSKIDTSLTTNFSNLFYDTKCQNPINMSRFNFTNATNLCALFYFCGKNYTLTNVNISTATKVTDISSMFAWCTAEVINTLLPANFNTSHVTDMSGVFSVASLDDTTANLLRTWNTSSVQNFSKMFNSATISSACATVINNFNTSSATNFYSMFSYCQTKNDISLNLSGWNTHNVTNFSYMFQGSQNWLKDVGDLSAWDVSNGTDFSYMFSQCYINVKFVNNWTISEKAKKINNMFSYSHLGLFKPNNWNVSNVTNASNLFYNNKGSSVDLSGWDLRKCTNLTNMFNQSTITQLKLADYMPTISSNSNKAKYHTTLYNIQSYTEAMASDINTDINSYKYTTSQYIESEYPTNWLYASYKYNIHYVKPDGTTLLDSTTLDGKATLNSAYTIKETTDIPTGKRLIGWATTQEKATNETVDYQIGEVIQSGILGGITGFETGSYDDDQITLYAVFSDPITTTLPDGKTFNRKIKLLYNPPTSNYLAGDNYITNIIWTDTDFSSDEQAVNLISDGGVPVYARLNGTVVELYTTAEIVYLNQNCMYMFYDFSVLQQIDFLANHINTSKCTNFNSMFACCSKLTSLYINNWDVSNCTDFESMFSSCYELTSLDINNWNTCESINFTSMFSSCIKLTSLDLSNWNVSNCTDFSRMFNSCWELTSLGNISNWDVSKSTTFYYMFYNCKKLITIGNLNNWNVHNSINFGYMFYSCENLENLDLSSWNVSNCTEFCGMFRSCLSLTSIGNLSNWNVSKSTRFDYIFYECKNLTSIGDLSNWNVGNSTRFDYMFHGCKNLTSIGDLSTWDVSKGTNFSCMFCYCKNLTSIGNLSNWNVSNGTNFYSMFNTCSKLTSIGDLSNWDVSNGTEFNNMFCNCYKLSSIGDISDWDVSNGTKFSNMFSGCKEFTYINLDNWDMCNAISISSMFGNCYNLSTIDGLNHWNTSSLQYAVGVFESCRELTSLDLSGWNTENCLTMKEMFAYCSKLTEIKGLNEFNLSSIITTDKITPNTTSSSVAGTTDMFRACNKLTTLELFDTSLIPADITMPNLPMTMKLDDNQDEIADTNENYTTAIRDTTSGTKHTYIKATKSIKLDYNGGTLNDETSHYIYFADDSTEASLTSLDEYLPTKDEKVASGYTRNNTEVTFPLVLPAIQNAILTAKYPAVYHVFIHSNDIYDEDGYPIDDSKVIDLTCTVGEDISTEFKNAYISATNVPLTGHQQLTAQGLSVACDTSTHTYITSGLDESPLERRILIYNEYLDGESVAFLPSSYVMNLSTVANIFPIDGTRVDMYVVWYWDDIQKGNSGSPYSNIQTRNNVSDSFEDAPVIIVKDRYSNSQKLVRYNIFG